MSALAFDSSVDALRCLVSELDSTATYAPKIRITTVLVLGHLYIDYLKVLSDI